MKQSVTFLASFPDIQTAIKVGRDGMRFQMDVPESEMGNAVRLLTLRGVVLRVTVEALEDVGEAGGEEGKGDGKDDGGRAIKRSAAKRRVEQGDTGV